MTRVLLAALLLLTLLTLPRARRRPVEREALFV